MNERHFQKVSKVENTIKSHITEVRNESDNPGWWFANLNMNTKKYEKEAQSWLSSKHFNKRAPRRKLRTIQ